MWCLAGARIGNDVNGPHRQRLFFWTETLVNTVQSDRRHVLVLALNFLFL